MREGEILSVKESGEGRGSQSDEESEENEENEENVGE